ncbi:peptidyl-prolyl cis-trans isomerase [bacterium]|nr:peptidyl-prolyl cis-trans isomerase [bacterium]
MLRYSFSVVVVLLAGLLSVSIGQEAPRSDLQVEQVVAVVNGNPITTNELKIEFMNLTPQQKENLDDSGREMILTQLIDRKLLLDQAEDMSLDTFKVIKEAIEQAKSNIMADAVLNIVLQQQNLNVTDEQLQQYYAENESLFIIPTRVRISQIVVNDEATAQSIASKLKGGERFANLAREYSKGQEAEIGGDLGYFSEKQLSPSIAKLAFNMKVGEVTGVINLGENYHLIMVTDRIEPTKQAFEVVKEQLKQRVMNQLRNQTMQGYTSQLRKNAEITINNPVLYGIPVE